MGTNAPQESLPVWQRQDEVRRQYVRDIFASIAPRYDLLNAILSLALHHRWRQSVVRMLELTPTARVLDVCTGTGDLALQIARHIGPAGEVVALDFCEPMLLRAREKARQQGLNHIRYVPADALQLPFAAETFDAVTIAFGLRNLIDKQAAFREMARVLKPGGRAAVLELTRPLGTSTRLLYDLYALHLLPRIGKWLSYGDAYYYLPMSIHHHEDRATIAEYMGQAGFAPVCYRDLTLGVVCVHIGIKR
ncbi:MAG: bifunctional demethylmenaquinone methyltransferase/2-methoxy-6-polyprenyl-1,4-benzoquinol methylase UbiE [Fimbriimonadales bacterium]|nr:bifunctional demethylmenaquinone methyltransferase/2-methoxy-6-polyprenyl-1,4-benzoquinol methylase UbiE [Fimbriimonadales bacterium]